MTALFRWLGGLLFVLALAVCAWWYAIGLERVPPGGGRAAAMGVDLALFSLFALHHSLFARSGVKAAVARVLPASLERSWYVWTASLLLLIVCVFWRPVGGELYHARGWRALLHAAVQVTGLLLIARAATAIDPLELAGIRAAPAAGQALQIVGPYRWVRHPIYLGWILATFGAGHMTGDRLLFSTIAVLYLAAAVPFEERSLLSAIGPPYAEYRRRVRWRMVPFLY